MGKTKRKTDDKLTKEGTKGKKRHKRKKNHYESDKSSESDGETEVRSSSPQQPLPQRKQKPSVSSIICIPQSIVDGQMNLNVNSCHLKIKDRTGKNKWEMSCDNLNSKGKV